MESFTEGWYVKKAAEKRDKEQAVIEAARAWKKEGGGQSQVPSAAEARLWETLQALDSEEG